MEQPTIQSYSHPKTNQAIFKVVTREPLAEKKVLDVGAGEGFFCQLVGEYIKETYQADPSSILQACDLYPAHFQYGGVACRQIDFHEALPYEDNTFDLVTSIEVIEHLEDQFHFLRELYRITKPGGKVIVSTPNILNINSRIKYLYSGFTLLFDPLPLRKNDPVLLGGHIHPISLYYLYTIFARMGFVSIDVLYDRSKRSSLLPMGLLYPLIWPCFQIYQWKQARKKEKVVEENQAILARINSFQTLSSRTIIVVGTKP